MNFSHFSHLLCTILPIFLFTTSAAASNNIQDFCPTAPGSIFINGFPCKDRTDVAASDFKTMRLNRPGHTSCFSRTAMTLVTAAEFPGLNTLGLALARTDLELASISPTHSHPRAAEIMFVVKGTVLAGFFDTNKQPFKKVLKEGDVFVFPGGLLHFTANLGFERATVFSVLNSQNPGVVTSDDGFFEAWSEMSLMKLRALSDFEHDCGDDTTPTKKANMCQA